MTRYLTRRNLALGAFSCAFALYVYTLAPDVTYTDAGELAAVCTTLGVAHPTGYPLFTILGYLWTRPPWPYAPVWMLNLLGAAWVAGSAALFQLTAAELIGALRPAAPRVRRAAPAHAPWRGELAAFALALTYATARTTWGQATSIEVYSLHLLLLHVVLYCLVKAWAHPERAPRILPWGAFALGCGLSNHLTTVLVLPAAAWLFWRLPADAFAGRRGKLGHLALLALPLAAGLAFWLYLPLRSATHPEFDWGGVARGFAKLRYHVTGAQYRVWMFTGAETWRENAARFAALVPYQAAFAGLAAAAWGFVVLWRRARELAVFLALAAVGCAAYAFNYSIHDIDSYFVLAFSALLLAAAAAGGAWSARAPWAAAALLVLPAGNLALNLRECNRSDDIMAAEYTRIATENLAQDALVISGGWDYFVSPLWYRQRVEGVRRDIVVIDKELLRRTWYPAQLERWYPEAIRPVKPEIDRYLALLAPFEEGRAFDRDALQAAFVALIDALVERNAARRPVYTTTEVLRAEPGVLAGWDKVPEGFAVRLLRGVPPPAPSLAKLDVSRLAACRPWSTDHLDLGTREVAAASLDDIGRYALALGDRVTAEEAFRRALTLVPRDVGAQRGLDALRGVR